MPLHLAPSLSRRQFLKHAALTGAALILPHELFAGEHDDTHWALLSDTHIAADSDLVFREVHLADHLRRAVGEVLTMRRPAGVFINGDCALKDGQPGDYVTLTSVLKPLMSNFPLHLTLGNHDHRQNIRAALSEDKKPVLESKHVSLIQSSRANWILLDSLDKVNVTPGLLEEEQRRWLAKTLDAHSDKPALIMVHHDPNITNAEKTSGLVDTKELWEIIAPRRQVKALIFGHTHRWEFREKDGIHLVNLPAVAYSFAKEQPTGWTNCVLGENGAAFQLSTHDKAHPWHKQKKELAWR
jgi:3',5'-cyclic AMP phosphodiesterase CpdA